MTANPESDDDWMRWSDADLAWQGVFDAEPRWSIAHGVHVFVFKDVERLQAACENPEAGAHSITYRETDAAGVGAVILLAEPVTLSSIVHEVTHVALFWARRTTRRKQRALGWLNQHPESVPEIVGNLSAVLWHSLPADLLDQ